MFEEDSSLTFKVWIIKESSSIIIQTKKMKPVGFPEMSTTNHFKSCVTTRKTEGFIQELIRFELRFEGPVTYVKYFRSAQNEKRQVRMWEKYSPTREGYWPQLPVLHCFSWNPRDVRDKHTETYNKVQFLNNKDLPICSSLVIHSFIHSLVFSLRGRAGRNQSPVMWPVWLWHTASCASSWG